MNDKDKFIDSRLQVAAFYAFYSLDENLLVDLPTALIDLANQYEVRGSILLASEGVNGTICGSDAGVNSLLSKLNELIDSSSLQVKYSRTDKQAFRRFKSRRKNEIVTMGVEGINPLKSSGSYIEPNDWNDYLDDPDTLVIDTRNEYEVSIGTFEGAINPHTDIFRDFPAWADKNLQSLIDKKNSTKVAMFCTGGIRCEKATAYLKRIGFSEVHHLHGGILRYLEEIPEQDSRWRGECFVFDQRVALNHKLAPGEHKLCYACGMPLSPKDRERPQYIPSIQCHYCINHFTDEDRSRFAERQKHINELSKRLPGNTFWPGA